MGKGFWLGIVLAAVVLFVWGFLFWGIAPVNPIDTGLDAAKAQEMLRQLVPKDGVYVVPEMPHETTEAWTTQHRQGPLAMIFVRTTGGEPMAPMTFVLGFVHNVLTAFLIALLLSKAAGVLPTYGSRLGFVLLAGVAATIWAHAGDPIWLNHPWRFHLLSMFYDVVAWSLAGAVLARYVKR